MSLGLPFFLAFTVYGVLSPYLSVLVRDLGYSPTVVGLLLGLFEVAGIFGPFLLGRLSDGLGRYRPGLAIALALVLAALWPLSTLHHPAASALSLVVLAVGVRSILPLLDAAATLALGKTGDYGKVRTIGSVSFVLMALFLQAAPVFKPNTHGNIALWTGITAFAFLLSLPLLPDRGPAFSAAQDAAVRPGSGVRAGARAGAATASETGAAAGRSAWSPVFIAGLVMIGFGRLAMAPIASFFSLYVVEELKWDAVGLMWAVSAGSEIPLMFLSGLAIRRFGAPRLLAFSIAAVALRLGVYALFPSPAGAVSGQLLHSLCYGLFHPAAVAFVATHVPPERRAVGLSMYLSLGVGLPTFLGSSLGGFIVDAAGYRVLFASYILFAAVGLVLYGLFRRRLEAPVRS